MVILLTIILISAIIQVGALIYEYRKDHNPELKSNAKNEAKNELASFFNC